MSEQFEPISPSEAAQILSNSRWNPDEREQPQPEAASDPQYYGKEAVERGQGYELMPSANPVKQAAAEAIDSTELLRRDEEGPVTEPTQINYLEGGDPAKPMAENQTVSAEQAAADLSHWRENIGQEIEAAEAQQIRETIDALRSQPEAPAE